MTSVGEKKKQMDFKSKLGLQLLVLFQSSQLTYCSYIYTHTQTSPEMSLLALTSIKI